MLGEIYVKLLTKMVEIMSARFACPSPPSIARTLVFSLITVLFIINALGALQFSNKGYLFESNIQKEKTPIKSLLKLNYHKMMNYELCINDFLILIHGL